MALSLRAGRRRLHSPAALASTLCYVSPSTDPYTNLAFEDWLVRTTDPQQYVLYLWRNRPTVVIGRNQNPWKECALGLMRARDVWLARRTSGGGAVYHDLGNTNYTVLMPRAAFSRDTCAEMAARALQQLDVPAHVTARHDVAVGDRKVSGSAFRLTSARAFHHGTMLVDADLARLSGCLRSPHADHIDARGVDSVRSPVANLRDYSLAVDHDAFCDAVRRQFVAMFGPARDMPFSADVNDEMRRRIGAWEWLYGQTPDFEHRMERHFPWATVSGHIAAHRGHIAAVNLALPPMALGAPPHISKALADIGALLSGARYDRAAVAERLALARTGSAHAAELCDWIEAAFQ
ncbi:hypothetical protein IWW54_005231 [Coemansia sp. RSA 2705]|nr:hypothetical protein IWW54_005231 [Coemansia sp. RSA 2705]